MDQFKLKKLNNDVIAQPQYIKIENSDHEYAGEVITCYLKEDDMQCGKIFFNESTRVLKFYCTFCREVYDNINYFCEHLSGHMHEEIVGKDNRQDLVSSEEVLHENAESEIFNTFGENRFAFENNVFAADELEEYNGTEMIVEELDEAEEIAAEVEEEMRQELEHHMLDEDSCSSNLLGYDELHKYKSDKLSFEAAFVKNLKKGKHEQNSGMADSSASIKKEPISDDFENLIDTSSISTSVPQLKGRRKKRVTTVKVIARRNRVAELYEKIKSEEEKRSKMKEVNGGVCGDADIVVDDDESIGNDDTDLHEQSKHCSEHETEPTESMPQQVVHKIIGETVITLIPESSNNSNVINAFTAQSCHNSSSSNDKNVCPACGKQFRNAFSLTIHKRSHYLESNSSVKLAHKCSDCNELFNKISDLKDHIQEVHYPDGFICKICNKKLTSLTLLETHMRKVHLTRPFSCQICSRSYDCRERLEEHVNAVHVGAQNYRCHICGRKYSTEYILKEHLDRHKEPVPQTCVVCGKRTLRITQHMKIHAPRPKRVLSCSVCGKVFNFSSGLSHHFKIMHKQKRSQTTKQGKGNSITTASIPMSASSSSLPTKRKRKSQEHNSISSSNSSSKKNTEEIKQKEEEAKRVIVEMIQNGTYTSFLPDNFLPPIAREETISAVNSIVNDS